MEQTKCSIKRVIIGRLNNSNKDKEQLWKKKIIVLNYTTK